jgi:protein phosphatase
MIVVHVAARSDKGNRTDNQDSLLAVHLQRAGLAARVGEASVSIEDGEALLLAVCDGMGGVAGGAMASRIAVETLEAEARTRWPRTADVPADPDAVARRVASAVGAASRQILDDATRNRALQGMGTTATVAALDGTRLVLGQVGDSRAYLFRGDALTQLTRDQTLANLLIERGQLTPEDARHFEHANIILQALGTQETLDVDLRSIELSHGDVVLLCSDGLWGPVDDADIARVLGSTADCGAATAALVDLAIEKGAPDNVTCIVARFEGSELRRKAANTPSPADPVVLAPLPSSADDTQPVAQVDADRATRLLGPGLTVAAIAALALCTVGGALFYCR